MIDFENYERVTRRNEHSHGILKDVDMVDLRERLTFRQTLNVGCALDRLTELEDLIEKGKLIPKYCIVKDYVGYHICVQPTVNMRCRGSYDNKKEAVAKLKELMESDENE